MRKYLIATHGTFAKGIQSSLDIIIGQMENIFSIQAYTEENKSIEEELKSILKQLGKDDELLVFTDLLGGSVTNQVLQFALKENVYIVSGFNLPLLLDILLADTDAPISEVIETGIQNAKDQIVFVNKLINQNNKSND
jgi:fructoselysine/glucoselysine PTS system EIIA component